MFINSFCLRSCYLKFAKTKKPFFNIKSSVDDISFKYKNSQINRKKFFNFLLYPSILFFNNRVSNATQKSLWSKIDIPVDSVLFDIEFTDPECKHGWLIGSKGTFLETNDGGSTWIPRSFANLDPDEELTYRFENISFNGQEGWVIGKPAIILYTKDGGKSWFRVPVSPKLPGEPCLIKALGSETAELTTTSGAIYVTNNGGRNWKAQVKETIDSTLNRTISSGVSGASYFTGNVINVIRNNEGKYLAISSRGNFYLTWEPGQDFWIPRARETSRRIQSMGFIDSVNNKGIWMSTRGGGLSVSSKNFDFESITSFEFENINIKTGGYGILDAAFVGENDIWVVCGGGIVYRSQDKGISWKKEEDIDKLSGNLYKIKFLNQNNGFILGSNGLLLKYNQI
uniref:Photosynthesis system II assembly factor Ycf48/Hcf136-like domain-containing protein n=1 Tax=Hanusia phi TaxID=3032 RepID=A0A7S0I259_9CRYP|mmetsp:Transcript_8439/g.19133  ORF Transcript_8439/g.19133 Transcript_8439/m.19133 type:complete len:398 (+) Transcript_8439:168-1361(+)